MRTMETELQRQDGELYAMYLRSMEIAERQWLPSITPNKDSYNSYPHIKEVMRHIDRLLYDEECSFSLNCSELYILLCAILMHDIGKGAAKDPAEKDRIRDHAYDSYRIISTHWTALGLPTKKVAEIVADICRFHDCPDQKEMEELYTKYYVDLAKRTEPIRGRFLGALLYLGDHMDNRFTRTVPPFFKDPEPLEVVGNFRSKIADVRLDRQYKMVREILDKSCFEAKDILGLQMLQGDLQNYLSRDIPRTPMKRAETSVLYVIAKDVMQNEKDIALIKDELNVMGMPVKKWLIECDEQLFQVYKGKDEDGNDIICSVYALEPIINLDYCLEVLKGICMLSGGIFAQQFFQYSELVNFIREEDSKTYKVKCAVRRLSLLLRAEGNCSYVIYYDENNWSFYHTKKTQSSERRKCEECSFFDWGNVQVRRDQIDQKDVVYCILKNTVIERLERYNGTKG